ncbi:MAG: 6-bladed beta-propeller, partial [Nitritalea sp.]
RELRDIVLYPSTNEIGVLDGDKIIWYNTGDGSFTGAATELKNIMLDKVSLLDSNRLIGYAGNQCFSKQYCSSFYSFTKNGEITNQYLPIQKKGKDLYIDHENPFSGGRYSIGFTHLLNDTLYTIDASDQMVPKVLFDFTDMAAKKKSALLENIKDYKSWFNRSLKDKTVKGLVSYHETNDAIQFEFRRGTDIIWGLYLKKTKRLTLTDELISERILVNNNNTGIYEDKFISYISGDIILQINEYLSSEEPDKQNIIDMLGNDVYDYVESLDGVANPIIVFSKFKNDL